MKTAPDTDDTDDKNKSDKSRNAQAETREPALPRDLSGIAPLATADILRILDRADDYAGRLARGENVVARLRGRTVLTLFFEDSTRTRLSFEAAARMLGAEVYNFDIGTSSVKKGETLADTVQTMDAMLRPDAVIVRHKDYGAPELVARHTSAAVINAGDSWREHPTQALLDAQTIRQEKGTVEGLTVAIIGDIAHSRVAGSNMILLPRLGARVHVIAPPALLPETLPDGVTPFTTLRDGLRGADIVMTLRLQKERMEQTPIAGDEDYFREYGLTRAALAYAKPDALVMDPGPVIRGVQIADDVADDPARSLILKQVRNGLHTRMAVLDLFLNR